jgi:hypothetical protein
MKSEVIHFKSPKLALENLKPFIQNPELFRTGKKLKKFGGMLPRELLGNWLLCVAVNFSNGSNLRFCTDPSGGDGLIWDPAKDETWPTEHTLIMPRNRSKETADIETLILNRIHAKRSKGKAYASGKTLVVLNEAEGAWLPNKVARQLPRPLHFVDVWIVGPENGSAPGRHIYNVTQLDVSQGDAPVWHVHIRKTFDSWKVERIQ